MIWSCPSPISTAWYAAVRVWFESVASRQVYSNERDAEGMTDRGRELADIVPAPVGGYQGTVTPQQHGEDVKLARKTPVFLSAVLLTINGLAFAGDLIGQVSVIDGDTIEIHGTGIRIFGIDAPESDQLCRDEDGEQYRCGQKASNALFDFIDRRPVECVEVDRDRWKRAVSVCTVGGTDIADWLVRNGLALDWPKYSKGGYADAQVEAKREQRGMWAGSFKEPWNYRACKRSGGRPQSCSDD